MNAPASDCRFGEAVESYFGLYTAIVDNDQDPEGRGRVTLRLPWIGKTFTTQWVKVAQIYAGNGYGAYWIPEPKDQVIVAFLRGQLRHPIVIGSLYSSNVIPHAARKSGKDPKYFRTKGGHMLLMEDGTGKKIELIDSTGKNSVLIDSTANTITVKAQADVKVSGGANVSVEATGNLTLKGAAIKIEATGAVTVSGATINLN
ncbi:phage baseplate assembly protein V [Sphingomonas sp. S1-29]|uniref:phage baseplate assembly protein V n=1 Tax=Sphingomonas sp. S1-29 TaxID=2991074 RepID=UPI0022403952|nr:phage baseplate assembly protein V [Sphingomonas sp. S1-29]UZK70311.1 phage baseplate assembly protein V [Sphingomonas sp. S1-29]